MEPCDRENLADHDAPYLKPWSVDLPAGISKLEVAQTAIDETPKKTGMVVFAKFTPILGVKLDGNSIFSASIPGFSHVGSNGGWKPDAKSQLVLGAENSHQEFATFRYAEVPDSPMSGGFNLSRKSFIIKFRLTATAAVEKGAADE